MRDIGELIGIGIGGWLWTYLFGLAFGRLLFRNDPPFEKSVKAALFGFGLCYLTAGFGFASGDDFNFLAGFLYAPGAALAWLALRRYYRSPAGSTDAKTFE